MKRLLRYNFKRKFGLEYEFTNSYDSLHRMSELVVEITRKTCEVRRYEHTHNNYDMWVCKTDCSCGIELVSPILSGQDDLKSAAELLPHLAEGDFNFSETCGQHVHVEIADYSLDHSRVLAAYWVKMERFILNGTPSHRRHNEYCALITHDYRRDIAPEHTPPTDARDRLTNGRDAINFGNYNASRRRGTVEFRFGEMTFDPEIIKNRVRFLVWLVEMCKILPMPNNLKWVTPKQALVLLNLWHDSSSVIKYEYSPAVQSMRKWMLSRLVECAPVAFQKDIDDCNAMLEEIA